MPYYDQNTPILMAQGAAMRNGTPMRLVSPAPVLVQPQAGRQTQAAAAAAAAASLYSGTQQSLYGANVNTSVNGTTLGGRDWISRKINYFPCIIFAFAISLYSTEMYSNHIQHKCRYFDLRQ